MPDRIIDSIDGASEERGPGATVTEVPLWCKPTGIEEPWQGMQSDGRDRRRMLEMVEDICTTTTDLSQLIGKNCKMLPLMRGEGGAKPNKVKNDMEDSIGALRKGPSEASSDPPIPLSSGVVPLTRLL